MLFRRRSKGSPSDEPDESADPSGDAHGEADAQRDLDDAISADGVAEGPWDIEDAPEGERLDLGGLQIPTLPDVEIRLDTDPSGAVVGVLLQSGPSSLRIGAFAAPRRAGIWADIRAELLESLRADGGSGEEQQGPFGPELLAAVPAERGSQPTRFVGVDGPRWLLRGVFTGPAATDRVQAEVLEKALREVVVARGGDALPVRDPLPMALPAEVLAQAEAAGSEPQQAPKEPRRGPEITEIG